jgi:hypothetical protein
MVTDGSVRVERVGRAALAKIVQASIPKALRRFVRFTRVSERRNEIGAAVSAPRVDVPPFTPPDTWTRPPVSRVEWDLH